MYRGSVVLYNRNEFWSDCRWGLTMMPHPPLKPPLLPHTLDLIAFYPKILRKKNPPIKADLLKLHYHFK